jgi:fructose transport system permease protein
MIVLLVALVVFGFAADNFFKAATLSTILQQIAIVGILGCAQTLVVLTAGIDLSVGAIAVFCSVIMGFVGITGVTVSMPDVISGVLPFLEFSFLFKLPPVAAVPSACCGLLMGANGWLVARISPPFIVTLGTWQIPAANFIFSANETSGPRTSRRTRHSLGFWGSDILRGQGAEGSKSTMPTNFVTMDAARAPGSGAVRGVLMIALVAILSYVLRRPPGAAMSMPPATTAAAELAGVPTQKTLIGSMPGLFCAIAGWVMIGRFGSVSPTLDRQLGNRSITAVVIGGISLFGGRGSILGMIFGALIVGVFAGLALMGADPTPTC